MRFLNPKTDYAFKKIFGSEQSHDILISFLNAILKLTGDDVIIAVTINDPYQPPKVGGMKDTFLDVKVTDQRGHVYIVEMQVLNTIGFEKRVLYNACKAYVNQLERGDLYRMLTRVVAVTITDFVLFPELHDAVTYFELRSQENTAVCYPDLELVFAELPKFTLDETQLNTLLERWLYFLKTARSLTEIPAPLATEPAIVHALELANRINWTEAELDDAEKREMWLEDQRYLREQLEQAELRRIEAERRGIEAERRGIEKGLEQGRAEGEMKGRLEGAIKAKAELLSRLLNRRFGTLPDALVLRIETATTEQLDHWTERAIDAAAFTDVFDAE